MTREINIESLLFTLVANRLPMGQRKQSWKTWNKPDGEILCEYGSAFLAYITTSPGQEALVILPGHLWASVLLPQRQSADEGVVMRCGNRTDALLTEQSSIVLMQMIDDQVKARQLATV